MKAFTFRSHSGGHSWGEVEEVCILAEDEDQAWLILSGHKMQYLNGDNWTLEEVKPVETGVVFSTSYTLGV